MEAPSDCRRIPRQVWQAGHRARSSFRTGRHARLDGRLEPVGPGTGYPERLPFRNGQEEGRDGRLHAEAAVQDPPEVAAHVRELQHGSAERACEAAGPCAAKPLLRQLEAERDHGRASGNRQDAPRHGHRERVLPQQDQDVLRQDGRAEGQVPRGPGPWDGGQAAERACQAFLPHHRRGRILQVQPRRDPAVLPAGRQDQHQGVRKHHPYQQQGPVQMVGPVRRGRRVGMLDRQALGQGHLHDVLRTKPPWLKQRTD